MCRKQEWKFPLELSRLTRYTVLYQPLGFFIELAKTLYVDHCCSWGNLVLEVGSSKAGRWPFSFCVFMFSPCHGHWLESGCGVSHFTRASPLRRGTSGSYLCYLEKIQPVHFSSVTQLCPTLCDPHGLQQARSPCPSPTPSLLKLMSIESVMPSNHLTSVVPFSSHLQSFSASGSFQMTEFFASGGQSIGVSASGSVLPMNTQDWSPI